MENTHFQQKALVSEKSSQMAQNKRNKTLGENHTRLDVLTVPIKRSDKEWIESEKKKIAE